MNLKSVLEVPSPNRPRKRVGRGTGSGHGKTCGRGHKGQRSRSGFNRKWAHEGGQMPLLRRLPKRGFSNFRFQTRYEVVNVGDLGAFAKGTVVTAAVLSAAGLVKNPGSLVKILGNGELKVALTVQAHAFSKQAVEKIAAAGGKTDVVRAAAAPAA